MRAIKTFSFDIVIPREQYPLDETHFVKYYLVSFVGSSCRVHFESSNYNEVMNNLVLRNELRPDLHFMIYKSIVNFQLINP